MTVHELIQQLERIRNKEAKVLYLDKERGWIELTQAKATRDYFFLCDEEDCFPRSIQAYLYDDSML